MTFSERSVAAAITQRSLATRISERLSRVLLGGLMSLSVVILDRRLRKALTRGA
jgi:hypothetical protein